MSNESDETESTEADQPTKKRQGSSDKPDYSKCIAAVIAGSYTKHRGELPPHSEQLVQFDDERLYRPLPEAESA